MAKYTGTKGAHVPPPTFGFQKYDALDPNSRPPAEDTGTVLSAGVFNPPPQKMVLDRTMRPFDENW